MNNRTRIVGAFVASIIALAGATTFAPSAFAEEASSVENEITPRSARWAGFLNCNDGLSRVRAVGMRSAGNGQFWVVAGNSVQTVNGNHGSGMVMQIASQPGPGSWEVGGDRATSGAADCALTIGGLPATPTPIQPPGNPGNITWPSP
jgi:hypothetical protein